MYAGLQATLHNAHFTRKDGQPPFSADMFMPGYKAPEASSEEPQWKRDKKMLELALKKPDQKTREEIRKSDAYTNDFKERIKKANRLRVEGVPDSEIRAMMRS